MDKAKIKKNTTKPKDWIFCFCKGSEKRKWFRFWRPEWIFSPPKAFLDKIDLSTIVVIPTLKKEIFQVWGKKKIEGKRE